MKERLKHKPTSILGIGLGVLQLLVGQQINVKTVGIAVATTLFGLFSK